MDVHPCRTVETFFYGGEHMKEARTTGAVRAKIRAARELIESCVSPRGMGIWASRERYEHQLWTRDFVLAAAPALRLMGREDVVSAHLLQLSRRQRPSGKIPILFLDSDLAFLRAKVERSIREGKMSFMLQRYLETGGVEDLSPWTRDSEFLFAIGMLEHLDTLAASSVRQDECAIPAARALVYVRKELMIDGLVRGADWRDTNTWLNDAALLSNNCLLYHALRLALRKRWAGKLKKLINDRFWTGSGYRDYLGVETADALGQALGILYDVIPKYRYPAVLRSFDELHTPRGYLANDCRPNPRTPAERKLLRLKRMKQSFVIWPFIHGYVILALLKMGKGELAERAFREYTALSGFWEYYDPKTGKGYGAKEQLWSAALYLRAAVALGHSVTD